MLAFLTMVALALGATQARAQVYQWTSLAGRLGGFGSVDGTGAAARFYNPNGVAVDGSGNVYVADSSNSTIRKITSTGVVTTLAGSAGQTGSVDGIGAAARFNTPNGVAVDGSGNVYVADTSNGTIRKITNTGVVTTLAGSAGQFSGMDGTGAAAHFHFPYGVAVDGSGNVYVADTSNCTIRKITSTGTVTTLAGSAGQTGNVDGTGAAARFNNPVGVAVDGNGNVYVCDTNNSTIRKITSTGTVTTLAGGAGQVGYVDGTGFAARFSNPKGVAIDGSGNVYVADSGNNTIRKITSTGTVTSLAGGGGIAGDVDGFGPSAEFFNPSGVSVDGNGIVYVADTSNFTIRKITSTRVVTTLAGSAGYGSADGTGGAAQFYHPTGVAVDGNGNVYVADFSNYTIRKITNTGAVTTLAGSARQAGTADGTGTAARFNGPFDVAVDGNGNVYVADYNNHTIRKITSTGVVTTLAGSAGLAGTADGTGAAARFNNPSGIAVDGNGNVYVADYNNHTIRKITSTGAVTTLAGSAGQSGSGNGTGAAARFFFPRRVAVDGNGNVYVADTGNNMIRKITSTGAVTTLAGSLLFGSADGTGVAAQFSSPSGVSVDGNGNVYVGDWGNDTIRKITSAGVVTTIGGTPRVMGGNDGIGAAASFSNPYSAAVDSFGNLYVADSNSHHIAKGVPLPPPSVSTVSAIPQLGDANLSASVNPNGFSTQVYFKYGLDNTYGQSTSSQDIGSATSDALVTASLTGLTSHTLYHYTVVAQSVAGTTTAPDATFTTLDNPPVANNVTSHAPPIGIDTAVYTAAANTSDLDGDSVTITSVSGGHGEIFVGPSGASLRYLNDGFMGQRTYTVQVSDGFGGTASATLTLTNAVPTGNSVTIHAPLAGVKTQVYSTAASASDPDSDPVGVTGFSGGGVNLAAITFDGAGAYYVNDGFVGTRVYTLSLADGVGGTTNANVTLSNAAPVAGSIAVSTSFETPVTFTLPASDADGDALACSLLTSPTGGSSVEFVGTQATYTPGPKHVGEDRFTFTVNDGRGGVRSGVVQVTILPPALPAEIVAKGGLYPQAGVPGSGIPAGAKFTSFGKPAIDNAERLVFVAAWSAPKKTGRAIVLEDLLAGTSSIVAYSGESVPDETGQPISGLTFSTFLDPVLCGDGSVAFIGKVAGVGITSANSAAIFSDSGGVLKMVTGARAGNVSGAGVDGAAVFKSFQSINVMGSTMLFSSTFVGSTLAPGPGGITSVNNTAVWKVTLPDGTPEILVQKGATLPFSSSPVKSYLLLNSVSGSPAQNRFLGEGDSIQPCFQVTLMDKTQRIVLGQEPLENSTLLTVGVPSVARKFGIVAGMSDKIAATAMLANTPLAFRSVIAAGNDLSAIAAQQGKPAPGAPGCVFSSFGNPLINSSGNVAFTAKLKGNGVSTANNQSLYLATWDPETQTYTPELITRTGLAAPGVDGGIFASFSSLALPDALSAPHRIFLSANLVKDPLNGIVAANAAGVWGCDEAGQLHLLIRAGQSVDVGGGVTKTIKSFTVLKAVVGSYGVSRSFNDNGDLVYNATFTDATQAILTTQSP